MKRFIYNLAVLLTLVAIIVGCASSELVVRKPLETKLNQYSKFIFNAESNVTEDVAEEIASLEELAINRVIELNLFKTTELGSGENADDGSLVVKAVITEINKVSGLTRFLIGAFAGKASMTIDITFHDAKTGVLLGEYDITGKSGGTGYAGGTNEAISMAVDKIAEVLSQNYN